MPRLKFGRGIGHARTFELRQPCQRQAAILHPRRDHNRCRPDTDPIIQCQNKAPALPRNGRHAPRHGKARPEFQRLNLAPRAKIRARDAGRKAHVILDPRRCGGLPPDRQLVDDQRPQPLGPGIDRCGKTGRPCPHDNDIEPGTRLDRKIKTQPPRKRLRRRIVKDGPLAQHNQTPIRRHAAALCQKLRLGTANRMGPERDAVLGGKGLDPADGAVAFHPDQGQSGLPAFDQATAARGENGDDDIAHFGDIGHCLQHCPTRDADRGHGRFGPVGQLCGSPGQKAHLAGELRRTQRGRTIAFA